MSEVRTAYSAVTQSKDVPFADWVNGVLQEVVRADAEFQVTQRLATAHLSQELPTVEGISLKDEFQSLPHLAVTRFDFGFWMRERWSFWAWILRLFGGTPTRKYRICGPGARGSFELRVEIERRADQTLSVRPKPGATAPPAVVADVKEYEARR